MSDLPPGIPDVPIEDAPAIDPPETPMHPIEARDAPAARSDENDADRAAQRGLDR